MTIDRIFNPIFFLLLNAVIILAAEISGGGMYFFETGLIHACALFFIGFTILRIFYHPYTYDPIFEKFVRAVFVSLGVFAVSHIFEFVSMMIFHVYEDAVFASVANFYITSILIITMGVESFIRIYEKRSVLRLFSLSIAIMILTALTIIFYINQGLVSLETNSLLPYSYILTILIIGLYSVMNVLKIKRAAPVSAAFGYHLIASIILVIFAIVPNIFYEIFEESLHVPENQILYLAHFTFFIALSMMILSFNKLRWGGVYEDARQLQKAA